MFDNIILVNNISIGNNQRRKWPNMRNGQRGHSNSSKFLDKRDTPNLVLITNMGVSMLVLWSGTKIYL